MTLFDRLRSVTETAQSEQDLPDFLAERIYWIIENQDNFNDRKAEIGDLVEKVANYDTYGQTGYLGMGVNNVVLGKTLNRLEEVIHC